ncbi:MAG: response regulator [Spirochaetales bacterium]|nr:response regulator [Spirochaetales bacterium]
MPEKQRLNLYEAIFKNAPQAKILLDSDLFIAAINSQARKWFGVSSGSFLQGFLNEGKRHEFSAKFNQLIHSKTKEPAEISFDIQYSQEPPVWYRFLIKKMGNHPSHGTVFLCQANDVTPDYITMAILRKEKEESLRAQELAEKATKAKSDFLANMSHEIRTPIHTIIGMGELLQETPLDAEQQEYGGQIAFSADVLLRLVNDILDFSKIEAGKLNLEIIGIDFYDIIEKAVDLLAMEAHKKGLETGILFDPRIPRYLYGDPIRLRQIIVNLFSNAVKFTASGEVIVYVELIERQDEYIIVKTTIKDTGIGIPDHKQHLLFHGFSQVDSSTTRKFGGSGLGLSICKSLSAMMNGEIGVESREGKGSEFWFTAKMKIQEDQASPFNVRSLSPSRNRILVVDDNETSRNILKKVLEFWEFPVKTVDSGSKAYEMLLKAVEKGSPYSLCLIDLLMPKMDGWQLASEINSDKRVNSTKLFLLSPSGASGAEAKMKLLNWFDGYISKPVKLKDLFENLSSVLNVPMDLEAVDELEPLEDESNVIEKADILIAEDHEVNQRLFMTILEHIGHKVVIASNGKEALEAASRRKFDLIFMDVQMPVMNGYEATEGIRQLGITTPIIAVTASAIKGEREKCLEIGMTDFLTKPFKKKDLEPILEKYLRMNYTETSKENTMSDQADAIFDYNEAIETFMGKEEVVRKVISDYLVKAKNHLQLIKDAIESKNHQVIYETAHGLKGGAWNLAIQKFGNSALEMELAGKQEDLAAAVTAYKKMVENYRELVKECREKHNITPTLA